MKTMQAVVEGKFVLIDVINPATGRTSVEGETLEQVRIRYPAAELRDLDEWIREKEKALCTEPQEITRERWWEMLEVLPPQRWQRAKGPPSCESFELCEHTSGRVTSIFCRIGDKYFEWQGIAGNTLEAHAVRCGLLRKDAA